jgi:hypothetical protein
LKRQRLFIAELGNNNLGVVDLAAGETLRTIGGMSERVAYVPFADSIYMANGGDGPVRVLGGEDLALVGRIELGNDGDNVRVDTRACGYWSATATGRAQPSIRRVTARQALPSESPPRGIPDRPNQRSGLYQCAGRRRMTRSASSKRSGYVQVSRTPA